MSSSFIKDLLQSMSPGNVVVLHQFVGGLLFTTLSSQNQRLGFGQRPGRLKMMLEKKKKSSFTKGYSGKLMLTVFGFYVVLMLWTRNENSNVIRYPYTVTLPQDGQML